MGDIDPVMKTVTESENSHDTRSQTTASMPIVPTIVTATSRAGMRRRVDPEGGSGADDGSSIPEPCARTVLMTSPAVVW